MQTSELGSTLDFTSQMRVLHIRDVGPETAETAALLKSMSTSVDTARSMEDASAVLSVDSHDVVVLDVSSTGSAMVENLPDLRAAAPHLPILICASTNSLQIVASAIEKGVQDFVLRPVRAGELKMRIKSLSQRGLEPDMAKSPTAIEYGPLRFDIAKGDVTLDGSAISLTPRERSVLHVLTRARGNIVSKDQIASRVYSMDDDAAPQAIETYIHRLRRKTKHPRLRIATVRGLGYRLLIEDQASALA